MNENGNRNPASYSSLNSRTRSQSATEYGSHESDTTPPLEPHDYNNGIYLALVLAGSGFLLPYNSFVTAVDYYHERFPGTTIIFDMTLVYICVAFISVCLVNCFVQVFNLRVRITFGYVVAFVTLNLITILDIWFKVFDPTTSYRVTLLAVAAIAFGSTAQQSSFYGYTSMLPPRYTQAVMTGESAAGLIISFNRILTKALITDQRLNTIIFFLTSIIAVVACFIVFQITVRTRFVRYYVDQCREAGLAEDKRNITGMALAEEVEVEHRYSSDQLSYGVLVLDPSISTVVNCHEPDVLSEQRDRQIATSFSDVSDSDFRDKHRQPCCLTVNLWSSIKRGLRLRYEASLAVWPYMLAICMAYFVTLCLFPGIESEILSCRLRSWMPILLMAIFNASDFVGKVIASQPYEWPRCRLVTCTFLRLALVPLLMMCASPREKPILSGEAWSIALSLLLGLTNGYFGSVPMILAPSRVPEEHKEITGNIMMLSYSVGLTAGSVLAYVLDAFLGPQLAHNPCHAVASNVSLVTMATATP